MGSKYTGGVLLLAGIAVLFIHFLSRKSGVRNFVKNLGIFLLTALLVFSPWLLKNLLATGNPLYPFFFDSGSMDRFRLDAYTLPPWGDWKDILLLPLQATVAGFEGAPGYSATISPLLLALVPFSLIGYLRRTEKQRVALVIALTFGMTGWMTWLFASRLSGFLIQTRLYFGVFPAFALLAGAGFLALADIRLPGLRLGRIFSALVVMVLGFNLFHVFSEVVDGGALNVLLGKQTNDEYLGNNLGWLIPATNAIRELPDGSRVLMLWEPRSFYCLPKCIPDEVLDRWRHARQTIGEPEDIIANWQEQGFTHLLINRSGADYIRRDDSRYHNADWEALNDLLSQLGSPIEFGGAYELYSIQQ
jgi:hypothetical protein